MATFSVMEDDNFDGMFLTLQSRNDVVSLEETSEFKTVHNSDYSDISDEEEGVGGLGEKQFCYRIYVIMAIFKVIFKCDKVIKYGNCFSQLHMKIQEKSAKKRVVRNSSKIGLSRVMG